MTFDYAFILSTLPAFLKKNSPVSPLSLWERARVRGFSLAPSIRPVPCRLIQHPLANHPGLPERLLQHDAIALRIFLQR